MGTVRKKVIAGLLVDRRGTPEEQFDLVKREKGLGLCECGRLASFSEERSEDGGEQPPCGRWCERKKKGR